MSEADHCALCCAGLRCTGTRHGSWDAGVSEVGPQQLEASYSTDTTGINLHPVFLPAFSSRASTVPVFALSCPPHLVAEELFRYTSGWKSDARTGRPDFQSKPARPISHLDTSEILIQPLRVCEGS